MHLKEKVDYAIKVVENGDLTDEENLEALETEIKILRELNHPHIVQLKEVVATSENTYIVMELCAAHRRRARCCCRRRAAAAAAATAAMYIHVYTCIYLYIATAIWHLDCIRGRADEKTRRRVSRLTGGDGGGQTRRPEDE